MEPRVGLVPGGFGIGAKGARRVLRSGAEARCLGFQG